MKNLLSFVLMALAVISTYAQDNQIKVNLCVLVTSAIQIEENS